MSVQLPPDETAFRALFISGRGETIRRGFDEAVGTNIWNALLRRQRDECTHRCCDWS
jgi:hypothetical protein